MKRVLLIASMVLVWNYSRAQLNSVSTVVGNGVAGFADGAGTAALVNIPYELASDGGNAIYFCDTYNHAVRKYDKVTNSVVTVAGNGSAGFQDGLCSSALFNYPEGIVYQDGYLYIGDNYNHRIRMIDLSSGIVTTVAGSGVAGHQDGPAATAQFENPKFICIAKNGDLYISDYVNKCVRKLSNGQVTTIAGVPGVKGYQDGPGNTALFGGVSDLCIDNSNTIFLTDNYNHVIRKIDPSNVVSTYAGTGTPGHVDGAAASAQFLFPSSLDLGS